MNISTREKISGVVIIPGSSEFAYDVTPVFKKSDDNIKYCANGVMDSVTKDVKAIYATSSLNKLDQELPNNIWTALTVSWFAHFKNVSKEEQQGWGGEFAPLDKCVVTPKAEYKSQDLGGDSYTRTWKVTGKTRDEVEIVSKDEKGNLSYGGTPNDEGVKEYVKLLSTRYKVMFYPFLMVDDARKTWRGLLNLSEADQLYEEFCLQGITESVKEKSIRVERQVAKFFESYNKFILHYAKLTAPYIDAFLIGSEMVKLTNICIIDEDGNWQFPAIDCLIDLAGKVKQIFTSVGRCDIKVSYAADWSEYHHSQKLAAKIYTLDKLWASEYIDFVGIDAYFPITDTADDITYDDIYNGWQSGNQWDYYYANDDRNQKIDYVNQTLALKAVKHWWENKHTEADGSESEWIAKSKSIWFTEIGAASCDHSSNSPNIFVHDGGRFPPHSNKTLDLAHQDMFLSASLDFIAKELEGVVQEVFVYNWDARYIDEDPRYVCMLSGQDNKVHVEKEDESDVFAPFEDLNNWCLGHWICGKLLGYQNKAKKEVQEEFGALLVQNIDNGMTHKGFTYTSEVCLFPFSYPSEIEFLPKQVRKYGIRSIAQNSAGHLILPCKKRVDLKAQNPVSKFEQELVLSQNNAPDLATWTYLIDNPTTKKHDTDLKISITHTQGVTFLEFFVEAVCSKYYMNYKNF